jgi:hypothetical protein
MYSLSSLKVPSITKATNYDKTSKNERCYERTGAPIKFNVKISKLLKSIKNGMKT